MASTEGKATVLVVGSGGVGTMAAYALEKGGAATVTAVLRSNFAAVEKDGFHVTSIDHGEAKGWRPTQIRNTVPDVKAEGLAPYDFVVVATKNIPDIPPTTGDIIAAAVTPGHTTVVLIQNGLNIEKPIIAAFPQNPDVSCISFIGVVESRHGRIEQGEHDKIIMGAFDNPNLPRETSESAAKRFAELYGASAGVQCIYDPEVKYWRWRKLLYNSSYNSISAILQMDTSRMRLSEFVIDDLIRPIMFEIIAAAKADGVTLTPEMAEAVVVSDPFEGYLQPSMQQDAEKGNFVEYENLVGEPLREAERLGVATPYLKVVYSLLQGIQWKTKEAKGLITLPAKSTPDMKYGDK